MADVPPPEPTPELPGIDELYSSWSLFLACVLPLNLSLDVILPSVSVHSGQQRRLGTMLVCQIVSVISISFVFQILVKDELQPSKVKVGVRGEAPEAELGQLAT